MPACAALLPCKLTTGRPPSVTGKGLVDKVETVGGGEKSPLPRSRHGECPVRVTGTPASPTEPTSWSNQETGSGCEVTVKRTALLSFMLGATETSKGPEVAPTGMVDADRRAAPGVDRHRCAIQQNCAASLQGLQNQNRKSPLGCRSTPWWQRRR